MSEGGFDDERGHGKKAGGRVDDGTRTDGWDKRGKEPGESQPQGNAGSGLAPTKRTRTSQLSPRKNAGVASAPVSVQRTPDPAAAEARAAQGALTAAWIDTAMRPDLYAPPVQRKSPDQVSLSVSWSGKFGGDLSARVVVEGTNDRGKGATWHQLESEDVADADGDEREPAQRVSTDVRAERYKRYRVTVEPTTAAPHDRYSKTSKIVSLGASAQTSSVHLSLGVNRWNRKNVHDVWEERGVDRDKAGDVVSAQLFGRAVRVNRLVVPRVERTNALFGALDEATQQEIRDSIAILGGYAMRTTSKGTYSNHSIGCAVDVNYNMSTRQNFHFERRNEGHRAHLRWVQEVIQTDPAFSRFRILEARGQEQLEGARAFSRRFPLYLAELLELEIPQITWEGLKNDPGGELATLAQGIHDYGAGEIVAKITVGDLDKAINNTKDAAKKAQLREVRKYWTYTRAWLSGSTVRDQTERKQKKLVGMIPIHEQLLQVFLDAGWSWGGDWEKDKDYMHFEDKDARLSVEGKTAG